MISYNKGTQQIMNMIVTNLTEWGRILDIPYSTLTRWLPYVRDEIGGSPYTAEEIKTLIRIGIELRKRSRSYRHNVSILEAKIERLERLEG